MMGIRAPRNQNTPAQLAARKRFAKAMQRKEERFAKSQAAMMRNLTK